MQKSKTQTVRGRISFHNPQSAIRNLQSLVVEKAPLFAIAIASSAITFLVQRGGQSMASLDAVPPMQRLGNALTAYVRYLWMAAWPAKLTVFYPHPGANLPVWQAGAAALFLIAVSVFAIRGGRRFPYVAVGWFWYLGTLVPVIGLVQVGAQALADRYSYVPLLGIFFAVAWGARDLAARWRVPKAALALAGALWLGALTAAATVQTSYWRNDRTLFEHAAKILPDSYAAYSNLGSGLVKENRLEEAVKVFDRALQINPECPITHTNMGNALSALGRDRDAVVHYEKAAKIVPQNPDYYFNLGSAWLRLNRRDEARAAFAKAKELDPGHVPTLYVEANMLAEEKRFDEAVRNYAAVLAKQPGHEAARMNMGITFAMQKKFPEAAAQFAELIRSNPKNTDAYINSGHVFAEQGKLTEALAFYQKALELDPANPALQQCIANTKTKIGQGSGK